MIKISKTKKPNNIARNTSDLSYLLGIIGFTLAFLAFAGLAPVGLIISILAYVISKSVGAKNRFAIIGIWLNSIIIVTMSVLPLYAFLFAPLIHRSTVIVLIFFSFAVLGLIISAMAYNKSKLTGVKNELTRTGIWLNSVIVLVILGAPLYAILMSRLTLAIIGVVLAFLCFAPIGLIISIVAYKKTN